jgi:hypothetical protein
MASTSFCPPTAARVDGGHACVLKNTSSRCFDGRGKSQEISHGVELRLIPKAQRTGRFKWQRHCGEHIGIKADPLRGFCFSLDFRSPRQVARVCVGVLRLEVAINSKLVVTDSINQMPINQAVLGGHFGRRAPPVTWRPTLRASSTVTERPARVNK